MSWQEDEVATALEPVTIRYPEIEYDILDLLRGTHRTDSGIRIPSNRICYS